MFITIGRYWTWKGKSTKKQHYNKYILFQRQIFSFWWLLILSFLAGWTTECRLVRRNLGSCGHLLKFQSPWRTVDMDGSFLLWLDNNRHICTQSDKDFLFKQLTSRQACSPLIQLFFGFSSGIDQTNINRDIRDGNWLSSPLTIGARQMKNAPLSVSIKCIKQHWIWVP